MQAELLGKRMEQVPVDAIYTSDLIRAVDTARIAFTEREELLSGVKVRKGLREFDFGDLTGKPDKEVKAFYRNYYQHRLRNVEPSLHSFQDMLDMSYPGGENGAQVFERAMKVIKEICADKKQHVAVVTHGGLIRVLMAGLFGKGVQNRLLFGTSLENCSITQIHYDKEQELFYLDRFNDYAHIEMRPELLRKYR